MYNFPQRFSRLAQPGHFGGASQGRFARPQPMPPMQPTAPSFSAGQQRVDPYAQTQSWLPPQAQGTPPSAPPGQTGGLGQAAAAQMAPTASTMAMPTGLEATPPAAWTGPPAGQSMDHYLTQMLQGRLPQQAPQAVQQPLTPQPQPQQAPGQYVPQELPQHPVSTPMPPAQAQAAQPALPSYSRPMLNMNTRAATQQRAMPPSMQPQGSPFGGLSALAQRYRGGYR